MAFITNPYDATLDLTNREDRKLFQEGSKGLKEDDKFAGKKVKYNTFAKLMGKSFEDVKVMSTLTIPTVWDEKNADVALQRLPTEAGLIDMFKNNSVSKEQVRRKSELVWANTTFGADTMHYHARFETTPVDTPTLNAARNKDKLKHVMMGKMLWNSLTLDFQVENMGSNEEFKMGSEYDGPLLWDFIKRRIKPSTKVGASKLKEGIEKKELRDFGDDVTKLNTWYGDTRLAIISEEGEGYNEYLRMLFRAYLGSDNAKFKIAVEEEHRKWIQGKLPTDYSHVNLMELGRVTFNNLVENDDWKSSKTGQPAKEKEEKNFLALATEILKKFGDNSKPPTSGKERRGEQPAERTYQAWRTENPNNEKERMVKGTKMKWCTNNCHEKPMWCGRRNCLGREDFKKMMDEKRSGKESAGNSGSKIDASKDFRIALAAMVSPEDLETLSSQFLKD